MQAYCYETQTDPPCMHVSAGLAHLASAYPPVFTVAHHASGVPSAYPTQTLQVTEFVLSCGAHEYSDSVNSFSAWRTDQHAVHEPAAAALLAPEARAAPAPVLSGTTPAAARPAAGQTQAASRQPLCRAEPPTVRAGGSAPGALTALLCESRLGGEGRPWNLRRRRAQCAGGRTSAGRSMGDVSKGGPNPLAPARAGRRRRRLGGAPAALAGRRPRVPADHVAREPARAPLVGHHGLPGCHARHARAGRQGATANP
jgi:hypothetical protein